MGSNLFLKSLLGDWTVNKQLEVLFFFSVGAIEVVFIVLHLNLYISQIAKLPTKTHSLDPFPTRVD